MKNQGYILIIQFIAILLFSNLVSAGPGLTGGGGAFVCRDANRTILDSELVDLWEAKALDHWQINYSSEKPEIQAQNAINKLKPFDSEFFRRTSENLQLVLSKIYYIPNDQVLAPPQDVLNGYQKPGCPVEGLAYYDGIRDRVAIDQKVFDLLLTTTDKAATYVHEALYKTMREIRNPHENSLYVRRLVGCLFSVNSNCLTLIPIKKALPKGFEIGHCQNAKLEFYRWKDQGLFKLLFSRIGRSVFEGGAYAEYDPKHYRGIRPPIPLQIQGLNQYSITGADITEYMAYPDMSVIDQNKCYLPAGDLFEVMEQHMTPDELLKCEYYAFKAS